MEQQIKTAAKLYQCRDTAKRFWGEKFHDKIKPYQKLISDYMVKSGKSEIGSVIELAKLPAISDDGMAQMLLFAAVVEIIEPTK